MALRTSLKASATRRHEKALIAAMERAHTMGMRETIAAAQQEMRDDVEAAGLGYKLAGAVRKEVYPNNGTVSLDPAGMVYAEGGKPGSRSAAAILGHYERGAPITPLGGALAIPTDKVPLEGRFGRRRLTPREVEAKFGRKLQRARLKGGTIGLFLRMRSGKGTKSVLMFTLVKSVPGRKALDFAGIFRRQGERLGERCAAHFEYRG